MRNWKGSLGLKPTNTANVPRYFLLFSLGFIHLGTRLGEDMEEGQEIIHHEEGEVPVEKDEEEQVRSTMTIG